LGKEVAASRARQPPPTEHPANNGVNPMSEGTADSTNGKRKGEVNIKSYMN